MTDKERCPKCGDELKTHRPPKVDCRYNGWTNYETWCVNLWLTNDEGSYNYTQELARDAYSNAVDDEHYKGQTREQAATYNLAESLKADHESAAQDMLDRCNAGASVFADLLTSSLGEVNWYEIAEHFVEERGEEE